MAAEQCNKTNVAGAQCLSTTGHRGRHRYPLAGRVMDDAPTAWRSNAGDAPRRPRATETPLAAPLAARRDARSELDAMTSMLETLVALEPRQRVRVMRLVGSYLDDLEREEPTTSSNGSAGDRDEDEARVA